MRDGHNGYGPSAGLAPAREAVADEYTCARMPGRRRSRLHHAGTSEAIELALSAIVDAGDEVLVPMPTYPLYTAVLAKIGARAVYYRTDPARGWLPDLDDLNSLITPATRALVVIDPNNPTGAVYPDATAAGSRPRRSARPGDSRRRGLRRSRPRNKPGDAETHWSAPWHRPRSGETVTTEHHRSTNVPLCGRPRHILGSNQGHDARFRWSWP